MNKLTKLSLVACTLVTASSLNAKDLSEAIKNTDISGTIAYRYNDYQKTNAAGDSSSTNYYKVAVNLKSKVNDNVVANTRVIAGKGSNAGDIGLDTQSQGDGAVDVFLTHANFAYTGIKNATFALGKQAINTPFTMAIDSIGNEHTGTGFVANYNSKMFSANVAYFNQSNFGGKNSNGEPNSNEASNVITLDGSEDIYAAGIATAISNVKIDAAYFDVADKLDAYTVGVKANYQVSDVKLSSYARYSQLEVDNSDKTNSLWKAGIKANMGIFGVYAAYGETNEEGGTVGIDASSETGFDEHWRVTLSTISDASVLYTAVDAQVTPKINVALKYSDLEAGQMSNSKDQTEYFTQVAYKMSSNFLTYVRFGQFEFTDNNKEVESMIGRLHVQYSF